MLTNELMSVLDNLVDAQDPAIFHQLQGRARVLRELLNLIEQVESHPDLLRHPARHVVTAAPR